MQVITLTWLGIVSSRAYASASVLYAMIIAYKTEGRILIIIKLNWIHFMELLISLTYTACSWWSHMVLLLSPEQAGSSTWANPQWPAPTLHEPCPDEHSLGETLFCFVFSPHPNCIHCGGSDDAITSFSALLLTQYLQWWCCMWSFVSNYDKWTGSLKQFSTLRTQNTLYDLPYSHAF